jgi:outer membrane protein TolC
MTFRRLLSLAGPHAGPHLARAQVVPLAALLLVAGCAVDQRKEVAKYRRILDSAVPAPAPTTQPHALTLGRAMAIANQNDETLGLSGENYLQALIARSRAVAAFLPTVSLQPNFTIAQKPGPNASASPASGGTSVGVSSGGGGFRTHGDTQTRFEAPVVGSINLFNGFGDVANLRASEMTIEQRRQALLDAQQTVLLNVAQVFYQALRSERQAEQLRNSLKVQQARVADQQDRLKNGLATQLEVAQSQAQAAATAALLAQAEGDVVTGRSTLAFVVGVPSVVEVLVDDLTVPDRRPTESDFEARALARRHDLLAARAQVAAARHSVDVAISQYYPSVTLDVAGFLSREFYSDASKWDAVLAANIPIFTAGLIRADVRDAWSRLRQAALTESRVRRQALEGVQTSYQNVLTSERRIRELQEEVRAADEALRQAQAQFANGLAILLDVLTAQDQLLSAQLQLTSARFDRSVFYLSLLRASGRLLPDFQL